MDDSLLIKCSVPTGLEDALILEINEKIKAKGVKSQGSVNFFVSLDLLNEVMKLRCADYIKLVIYNKSNFDFPNDKESVFANLKEAFHTIDFKRYLEIWRKLVKYPYDPISQNRNIHSASIQNNENEVKETTSKVTLPFLLGDEVNHFSNSPNIDEFKFRCSCNRSGENHSFESPEIAAELGSIIYDEYNFKASMKDHDLEVVVDIRDQSLSISFVLNKRSNHLRNIVNFGKTTLRSTIAACMLRLADIKEGDVVCDPLCGTASIPIEGFLEYKSSFFVCGDNHSIPVSKSYDNISAILSKLQLSDRSYLLSDLFQWDCTCLPLLSNSVDVFVSDMPFGKRMGSKRQNFLLYPSLLKEMSRVSKISSGRAILLTQDRTNISKSLTQWKTYWNIKKLCMTNIGGLRCALYILLRSSLPFFAQ